MSLTFLHFGDPQIGMGEDGPEGDAARFLSAVHEANALRPDFVLIAGDLVHKRASDEYDGLNRGLSALEVPYHLVPGNHDILSNEDVEGLTAYRQRFGADYTYFACGPVEFLCLNAVTLVSEGIHSEEARHENARQWNWLEDRIAALSSSPRIPMVLIHIPPFVERDSEPEAYFNLPPGTRQRFLDLMASAGVRWILTGHTHTTTEVVHNGMTFYTVGGTAKALDHNGRGFRRFHVKDGDIRQEYHRL